MTKTQHRKAVKGSLSSDSFGPFKNLPDLVKDLVKDLPSKRKGNPNYRAGAAMERALIKELRSNGLEGLRTAGSHGVADVVAFVPGSLDGSQGMSAHAMVEKVLEGWMRLPPGKVLGKFLYAGQRLTKTLEYDIHVSPVVSVLIQCKRRKR